MQKYSNNFIGITLLAIALILSTLSPARAAAIKDLAQLRGVRDNQLIGMGLVTGLGGTGDDVKSTPQAGDALSNLLARFGFQVDPALLKSKNFAAVMVTANMPAYAKQGDRLDIEVSAIGNAKSLEGGMLLMTELRGADTFYGTAGEAPIYALAQGSISLGSVNGSGRVKIQTRGSVPGGAIIEHEIASNITNERDRLEYNLRDPDFTTAARIAEAINEDFNGNSFGSNARIASALDGGTVEVLIPIESRLSLVDFISHIEQLEVSPDSQARVVIDQSTGTIAMGGNVRIRPVHVSHGNMSLSFGNGLIESGSEAPDNMVIPDGSDADMVLPLGPADDNSGDTTAAEVAAGLNKLRLSAQDIVEIFLQIHKVGAMDAELIVI
ncbi:flagellar basal body P-ring protein FlgI [bacterium]|nr:flagellar basal body P-ring protein FlgI [bacterium]